MVDWSQEEIEAIVADYLQMLTLELSGQSYSKTLHRRHLQQKLTNRSDSSVEFKHANISAVLVDLGFPYINGYKPRSNYQQQLAQVVADQVQAKVVLDSAALAAVQRPAVLPKLDDFTKVKTDAPQRDHQTNEVLHTFNFRAVKRDYLEREAANCSLGLAGEEFVLQFEHWRLVKLGQKRLAEKVQHVSQLQGDGLGYDVLSFDLDGRERLIEVKTTTFGKSTPFFVSRGELALSQQAKEQFHLYRIFDFRKEPRLFDLPGQLDANCRLDPVTYRATF